MNRTDFLFELWIGADASLKAAKAVEARLRSKLTAELLSDEKPDAVGTFNFYVCDKEISVSITQGITVDEAEYDIHKAELSDEEKAAITFKPTVVKKMLNKLPKDSTLKRECIIIKPGSPTIRILS